jgi:hypothetical protein
VVRNMSRWCRHLIITVPGGPMDQTAQRMGHLRHYDAERLRRLVDGAGMEVLCLRTWGFPLAYPLYARLRNRAGYEFVTGQYGYGKRALSRLLYMVFYMNDFFRGGNRLFLLARSPASGE